MSNFPWLEQCLCPMAHAQNIHGIAANLEQDSVNPSPFAMKQLANLAREPFTLGSESTALRVVRQQIDGFQSFACQRLAATGERSASQASASSISSSARAVIWTE